MCVKGRRRKISLSEHNMNVETYWAKVKTEGEGNYERGEGMEVNLVVNENNNNNNNNNNIYLLQLGFYCSSGYFTCKQT